MGDPTSLFLQIRKRVLREEMTFPVYKGVEAGAGPKSSVLHSWRASILGMGHSLSELLLQNLLFYKAKTKAKQPSTRSFLSRLNFSLYSSISAFPHLPFFSQPSLILICSLEMLATPIFLFCVQFLLDQ